MISATATTRTVASRWRRNSAPPLLRKLNDLPRGGVSPGGGSGRSVLFSTATLTLLVRFSTSVLRDPDHRAREAASPKSRWSRRSPRASAECAKQSYPIVSPQGDAGNAPTAGGPSGSRTGRACRRRGRHVLVVAGSELMAPDGRAMYFCAVVEPWNRLAFAYEPALALVMIVRPVSVSGGVSVPPDRLYMYMYNTGRKPCRYGSW